MFVCVFFRECPARTQSRTGGSLWRHGSYVQRQVRRSPESSRTHTRGLLRHIPRLPGVPLHRLLLSRWISFYSDPHVLCSQDYKIYKNSHFSFPFWQAHLQIELNKWCLTCTTCSNIAGRWWLLMDVVLLVLNIAGSRHAFIKKNWFRLDCQ